MVEMQIRDARAVLASDGTQREHQEKLSKSSYQHQKKAEDKGMTKRRHLEKGRKRCQNETETCSYNFWTLHFE